MFQKLENNKIIKILKNMEKYIVKDNVDSLGKILIIDDKLYFSDSYQKMEAMVKLNVIVMRIQMILFVKQH